LGIDLQVSIPGRPTGTLALTMSRTKPKAGKPAGKGEYSAPALEKGIEIVELLASEAPGLTISEIAARLGRSINEVFRMIIVMQRRGWLQKDPQSDCFSVTYRVLELAHRGTQAENLSIAAGPVMRDLAAATSQSCHLVVRSGGHGLVIQRQESISLFQGGFAMRLGAVVDLLTSCSGHILLAHLSPDELHAVLKLLPRPMNKPTAKLSETLKRVREQGYEIKPSARTDGITDISYPIRGLDKRVIAALTVPYLRVLDNSLPTTIPQTRQLLAASARKLSEALGSSG
jgi:DNA-binding IclR family transcriptional regulator